MAASRTFVRALHLNLSASAFPRSTSATSTFRLGGSQALRLQQRNNVIIRAQSSWVVPSKRGRRHNSNAPPRRPVVNGQSVAFHIKDLQASKTFTSMDSSVLPQRHPSPAREYDSDLVVVLDMDECLIHSQFLHGPGAKFAHQVRRANGNSPMVPSVDTFNISLPDGELVLVHERPHLHDFLREVSSKFETHVFTAAMEVYAKPVLDKLDPSGSIFTKRWYRESCVMDSDVGAYVKNLDFQWGHHLKRTVLVDNNPLSFIANPSNGILVSSFYNDPHDTTLPAVLDLLDELDSEDDVRPTLESRFGLKSALKELQSGRTSAPRQYSSLSASPHLQDATAAVAAS